MCFVCNHYFWCLVGIILYLFCGYSLVFCVLWVFVFRVLQVIGVSVCGHSIFCLWVFTILDCEVSLFVSQLSIVLVSSSLGK